ncbi:RNA polymerase recycling motor HelD [Priestia megaterium]
MKDKNLTEEQQRVDWVVEEISQKAEKIGESVGSVKGEIVDLRSTFWDDVTVNMDEPDDVIETFTSIKQQAELLAEREITHRQAYDQLKTLKKLTQSPYFGRFDFIENGEKEAEAIYVGVGSLMDQKDEEFLIYDWRAPISSLYYDYSPGKAQYETPGEAIKGEMKLKRQFIIENSVIKSMFDTGITIRDELLQEVLGHNASSQMKSIVATIQKEQNQIIRNEKNKVLIVQGVAGSGKTSAALQRVAYLLYHHRKQLTAENMMLFSPNPLFNSYVSTVLPELGEDNMKQTTFQQYADGRLGNEFDVEDLFVQIEYLLTEKDAAAKKQKMQEIRYKASREFKKQVDAYIEELSTKDIIFKNIKFRGEIVLSARRLLSYFYSLDKGISIPNRMQLVAEWALKLINQLEKLERKKDWVQEEIQLLEKEDYVEAYQHLQKKEGYTESSFDDFDREQAYLAKAVVAKKMKFIKQAIKQLKFIDIRRIYMQLFERHHLFSHVEGWDETAKNTVERVMNMKLSYEDVTPYLYIKDQIEGRKANPVIRYLFIDEAQDYSPFQLAFLKELFPHARMTLLGDLNQAIYAHALNAPTILSSELYEEKEAETLTLTRSYRSTRQIVEFSRDMVANRHLIDPFNRDGAKPTVTAAGNVKDLHEAIIHKINELKQQNYKTIAVIAKTAEESREAFKALPDSMSARLLTKETSSFEKGMLVLPAYLAKGIEFDAVIIYNASSECYQDEYERNLFYTACTRAMHELHLFSLGEISPFISNKETYEYQAQ